MVSPAARGTASAQNPNDADQLAELAVVIRSNVIESRHFGWLVALDTDGRVAAELGHTSTQVLPRSTTKPLQALACLRAGAELSGAELAIAAGSHTGEQAHVETVRRVLERAGLDESALACPADWPEDESSRRDLIRAGEERSRIHMNCSGKHAAMLLACAANGWETEGYLDPLHPLQLLVRETVERATGLPVDHAAVDGCGAPLFSTSVQGLARAFRTLVTAAPGSHERRVADDMRAHPFHVGGTGHANSETMALVPGVLAKGGAEGVIGMAASSGQAVAMKIIDGNPRATTLIGLKVLETLGVDTTGAGSLMDLPVLGGSQRVGQIEIGSGLTAWADGSGRRW